MRRRRRAGKEENMCLLCLRLKLHLLKQTDDVLQNSHYLHFAGPKPPAQEGEEKERAEAKKAGGQGRRVPSSEWKTGSAGKLIML